jgi:alpha-L-glutamate ligase-like protein
MNRRNLIIERVNPSAAVHLVNRKHETKELLARHGVPVVDTIALVRTRRELLELDWDALPDAWALKPNGGARGAGILLAAARSGDGWRTGSGRELSRRAVAAHARRLLDGEDSLAGARDTALFEPLVVAHPALRAVAPGGLPDVRVICVDGRPLASMVRLPTERSEGRANLHQGAVGAAVDLAGGTVTRAVLDRVRLHRHPDSGAELDGLVVPEWDGVVEAACAAVRATGLGYGGADVVVDAERGPVVMEVNARPGLEIQNVIGAGLAPDVLALAA